MQTIRYSGAHISWCRAPSISIYILGVAAVPYLVGCLYWVSGWPVWPVMRMVTRHGTYCVQPQAPGLAVDINSTCEASSEHAITRHEPYSASGPGPVVLISTVWPHVAVMLPAPGPGSVTHLVTAASLNNSRSRYLWRSGPSQPRPNWPPPDGGGEIKEKYLCRAQIILRSLN